MKKIQDNTIKDNVKVTSSNFGRNDGTIRILTCCLVKNHSKIPDRVYVIALFTLENLETSLKVSTIASTSVN